MLIQCNIYLQLQRALRTEVTETYKNHRFVCLFVLQRALRTEVTETILKGHSLSSNPKLQRALRTEVTETSGSMAKFTAGMKVAARA